MLSPALATPTPATISPATTVALKRPGVAVFATRHALAWLVAGSAVGLWMATLLLVPRLGSVATPLTYGRWAAVHLDVGLYGWTALPLVGMLLVLFLPADGDRSGRLALELWSAALLAGCISWLRGGASGELFLDWTGVPRLAFVAALAALAVVLATGWWRSRRRDRGTMARGLLLALLLPIPLLLHRAADPTTFPAVDPTSGGPTGHSLLVSSLPLIALLAALPYLLGLRPGGDDRRILPRPLVVYVVAELGLALSLPSGDRSHHEPAQWAALATVALAVPFLVHHLRRFPWPADSRRWILAGTAWGALLAASGILIFLPGVLERYKFTNVLVAHSHMALAGLATALSALILDVLLRRAGERPVFARGPARRDRPFLAWNLGCGLLTASLLGLGLLEGAREPGWLQQMPPAVIVGYGLRWAGGAAMTAAAIAWLRRALAAGQGSAVATSPSGVER